MTPTSPLQPAINHRRAAGIAISLLAVVNIAACAGDDIESTDTAETVAVATTDSATTPALPDTPVAPDVTGQLQAVVEETVRVSVSIPGLILHLEAPGEHLDVSVAAGVADRATETPLTPDAGFRIASNTKTFTAAAVLRLVEQNRLALDTPIDGLLAPETVDALLAGGYRPDAITVRHLLVHTSGICGAPHAWVGSSRSLTPSTTPDDRRGAPEIIGAVPAQRLVSDAKPDDPDSALTPRPRMISTGGRAPRPKRRAAVIASASAAGRRSGSRCTEWPFRRVTGRPS